MKTPILATAILALATPAGLRRVVLDVRGMAPGGHAVHFHEVADCSAADFTSAGGHIADGMEHGVMVEGGPHPGDLPNLFVGADGGGHAEFFTDRIEIGAMLLDGDGAAFIVHAEPDDYTSQPGGAAGDRIACGEFVVGDTSN